MALAVRSSELSPVKIDEWVLVVTQALDIERGHRSLLLTTISQLKSGVSLATFEAIVLMAATRTRHCDRNLSLIVFPPSPRALTARGCYID